MKKFDFITIGGATRDILFKTDKDWIVKNKDPKCERLMCFEHGAKIIPKEFHFCFGGGALNSATSIARLGLKVGTFINVGMGESKRSILKHLELEKIDGSLVSFSKKYYRGLSIFIVDKGHDHTGFLYRGANNELSVKNWDFLKKTKWVYISSLTGKSDLILKKLSQNLKKHKTHFAWNPGGTQLKKGFTGLKKLMPLANVFILNKDEAIELVLSKDKNFNFKDIFGIIYEIKKWGPKIVVITDGQNGVYAFDGKKLLKAEAVKTKVFDTTGAGDAFGSSFVAGLEIFKGDIKKSLVSASINASSVVSHIGAQNGLLPFKKIKGLKKVKVSETKP